MASTAAPTPVAPLVHGRLVHHNGHCCNCCNACYGDVPNGHKVPSPNEIQGFGFLDLDQHKVTCQCPSTRSESFCLIPCYPKSATSKCRKQHMHLRIICTILYQFSRPPPANRMWRHSYKGLVQHHGTIWPWGQRHLQPGTWFLHLVESGTFLGPQKDQKRFLNVAVWGCLICCYHEKEKNSDSARSL